jgi:hypothetical protein
MDDLNRSYMNTPGGGHSRLDPSRVRASAASLSHREDVMKLKTVELLLKLSDFLSVSRHENRGSSTPP